MPSGFAHRLPRLLARVALVGGGLLLGAAAVVCCVSEYRLRRAHTVPVAQVAIPTDSVAIERGRHLATSRGCADCHRPDFGGGIVVDDPMIGRMAAPNLTSGRGGLPEGYSDEDFVRAIRHGVAANGRGLVLMPSEEYTALSDADLGALIAYLKSVPAVDRERTPIRVGPLARVLMLAGEIKQSVDKIDHAQPRPSHVPLAVTAEYGRYVATSCTGCHGDNFSGGRIAGAPPEWPPAANLTRHPSGRLQAWTEADFFAAIRTGQRPDGTKLNPAMPAAFGNLTDDETRALWLFLQTLAPAETGSRSI